MLTAGPATYTYDRNGNQLSGSGNNQKTNFTWDPNNGLPMLVREASGNGSLLRRYINGLAGPIFMSTSSTNAFYHHTDPLGSVRDITDTAGVTQNTYDYEPYGAIRTQTGALANFVKFTGEYQDPTGLYHLRARQLDPSSGRFLTVDQEDQTVMGGVISPYGYASNRPTLLIDPGGGWAGPPEPTGPLAAEFASTSIRVLAARPTVCPGGICVPGGVGFPTPFQRPGLGTIVKGGIIAGLGAVAIACGQTGACRPEGTSAGPKWLYPAGRGNEGNFSTRVGKEDGPTFWDTLTPADPDGLASFQRKGEYVAIRTDKLLPPIVVRPDRSPPGHYTVIGPAPLIREA